MQVSKILSPIKDKNGQFFSWNIMYAAILFLMSSLPEKHNFIFLMWGGGGGGN